MIIKTLYSILKGIRAIVSFFTAIVTFVIHFIRDLVSLIKVVGAVLGSIPGYFSFFPVAIVVLLVIFFSCAVMFRLIGREG